MSAGSLGLAQIRGSWLCFRFNLRGGGFTAAIGAHFSMPYLDRICRDMLLKVDHHRNPAAQSSLDWKQARHFIRTAVSRQLYQHNDAVIDDIVQDALVRLLRASRKMKIENPEAMMNRVANFALIDHLRRNQRYRDHFEPIGENQSDAPDPAAEMAEVPADPQQRVDFIVLEFFRQRRSGCIDLARAVIEKRNWRQVAQDLGKTHDGVRAQWYRCVKLLKGEIASDPALSPLTTWAKGG